MTRMPGATWARQAPQAALLLPRLASYALPLPFPAPKPALLSRLPACLPACFDSAPPLLNSLLQKMAEELFALPLDEALPILRAYGHYLK